MDAHFYDTGLSRVPAGRWEHTLANCQGVTGTFRRVRDARAAQENPASQAKWRLSAPLGAGSVSYAYLSCQIPPSGAMVRFDLMPVFSPAPGQQSGVSGVVGAHLPTPISVLR